MKKPTANNYVEVTYAYGASFNKTVTVGVSGTAVFPVLPYNDIQVMVGNTNLSIVLLKQSQSILFLIDWKRRNRRNLA